MDDIPAFHRRTRVLVEAASKDMTVLATVKARLNITVDTYDDLLATLIHEASADFVSRCNRELAQETVEDVYRERRCFDVLWLSRRPLVAIAGMAGPDEDIPLGITVGGVSLSPADYELDERFGRIWRRSGTSLIGWPGCTDIVVTHTSGWLMLGDLPSDIEPAVIAMVKVALQTRARDGTVRRVDIPGLGEIDYAQMGLGMPLEDGLPKDVAAVVKRYRDWVVV